MSATIISFAQFQESRQRRNSAHHVPHVQPPADPAGESSDDQPLTITCEAPGQTPREPAPLPQRP